MGSKPPHFIGISGGSCTGKTWLACRLHDLLGKSSACLSLDDFYADLSHIDPKLRSQVNFDHPDAIDWPKVLEVLRTFSEGKPALIPSYDFVTHTRKSSWNPLAAAPVMIVEGLWLFHRSDLRDIFNLKVFLKASQSLCEQRRVERDVQERGRTRDQSLEQFRKHTAPMYEQFVAPQERWADVVLDGPPSLEFLDIFARGIQTRIENRSNML